MLYITPNNEKNITEWKIENIHCFTIDDAKWKREREGKRECVKEKMINVDFWRWLLIFYFSETSIYKQLNSNNQIERDENTKKWKLTWQLNHSTISFVILTISWEVGTLMLTVPSHQDMYFYLSDEMISMFHTLQIKRKFTWQITATTVNRPTHLIWRYDHLEYH